jgi:hypothetical protein
LPGFRLGLDHDEISDDQIVAKVAAPASGASRDPWGRCCLDRAGFARRFRSRNRSRSPLYAGCSGRATAGTGSVAATSAMKRPVRQRPDRRASAAGTGQVREQQRQGTSTVQVTRSLDVASGRELERIAKMSASRQVVAYADPLG